ncbi:MULTISPECIES: hypothetical protein [unclassified Streptomyces]|uniref:hypothetical protein n=1 Tax=unclassified Streptomyces TaxID=2593676 RepID=UPI0038066125
MKFKNEQRTRWVPQTNDGITHQVPEHYDVAVPVLPRDWDVLAVRAGVSVVGVLTVVTIVWSTVSIGALLGGGVGFAAAVVFDLAWLVNVLLEYLSRFDQEKRTFAKRLGWGLLAATMGAILWHGLLLHNVALGVVGAAVSLFAKVLWMGIMKFINRDLSEADRHWVAAEISKANAKLAVASVRRQVAHSENTAAAELLAAERERHQIQDALAAVRPAPVAEPVAVPAAVAATQAPAVAPTREPASLEAAVKELRLARLAAEDGYGDDWHRASRDADLAMDRAVADGWSVADVMEADRSTTMRGRERELELRKAAAEAPRPDTSGQTDTLVSAPARVRPDTAGRPDNRTNALVNGTAQRPDVRTDKDVRPEPAPQHDGPESGERVPEQRPPSIAAGVRLLTGMGQKDPEQIARHLSDVLGKPVSSETVSREIRRASTAPGAAPGTGTGQYL